MKKYNPYAKVNKAWWERMVKEECGFTKPWLKLNPDKIRKIAKSQPDKIPTPINDIYPISLLKNVKGKRVLCLAASGGQQSAVFGILGAKVTVVDIAEGQLEGDRKAARHYGYEVDTVKADISDLSALKSNFFNLVYQAPSMVYLPEVEKVYREVVRVLKKGGIYRVDAENPLSFSIDDKSWDGKGYRLTKPFTLKMQLRSKNEKVFEFRHYLSEVFNGLIKIGFIIESVEDMPKNLYQRGRPKPNTWEHCLLYAPGGLAILAKKK